MGMGMVAYITYWPRFAFDVTTGIRTALPEMRGRDVTIYHDSLAECWVIDMSFYCTRMDDGRMEIDELCHGKHDILDSIAAIRGFIEGITDSWGIVETLSNELSDDLSNEEIERHAATLHECVTEELEQMATRAWKDCENEEIV